MTAPEEVLLTRLAAAAGSEGEPGPSRRAELMRAFEGRFEDDANLLSRTVDGTAVYRVDGDTVLIEALRFIHPPVDDPTAFGAIAAAHAMSGVFAAGGEVVVALNLAGFPDGLPLEVISAVFAGGADKVAEAGGIIAGGHTVLDAVPKYGLSVTGTASPAALFSVSGALPGDLVVLGKALGTGMVLTAARAGVASPEHVEGAVQSMQQLNREAARIARTAGAHAVTDVSAHGLMAAALDIAERSGVLVALRAGDLPVLPGALQYAGSGLDFSACVRNLDEIADRTMVEEELPGAILRIAYDPQTSGGLLMAVEAAGAGALLEGLRAAGYTAAVIGSVHRGEGVSLDP